MKFLRNTRRHRLKGLEERSAAPAAVESEFDRDVSHCAFLTSLLKKNYWSIVLPSKVQICVRRPKSAEIEMTGQSRFTTAYGCSS